MVTASDPRGLQRPAEPGRHVQCIGECPYTTADIDQSPIAVQRRLPTQHLGECPRVRSNQGREVTWVFHILARISSPPPPASHGRGISGSVLVVGLLLV